MIMFVFGILVGMATLHLIFYFIEYQEKEKPETEIEIIERRINKLFYRNPYSYTSTNKSLHEKGQRLIKAYNSTEDLKLKEDIISTLKDLINKLEEFNLQVPARKELQELSEELKTRTFENLSK